MLKYLSKSSNDPRFKLGSFTTRGWRITSTGCNTLHDDNTCTHAEVAAMNKIEPALRPLTVLYCSWSPCKACETYLRENGVSEMYYIMKYPGNDIPEFCKQLK